MNMCVREVRAVGELRGACDLWSGPLSMFSSACVAVHDEQMLP